MASEFKFWNPEKDHLLHELWMTGATYSVIGPQIERSWSAITRRAKALGLPSRPRGRPKGIKASPRQLLALSRGPLTAGKSQQDQAWGRSMARLEAARLLK